MGIRRVIFCALILFIPGGLSAQNKVSNIDFSYWYKDEAGIMGDILCSIEDSTATMMVKVDQPLDSLRKYQLSLSLVNSLEDEISSRSQLSSLSSYFQYEDNLSSYYGIRAKVGSARYLILWFSDTVKHVNYPLMKELNSNSAEITMYRKNFNAPIISTYLNQNAEVRIRPLDGSFRNMTVKYYDHSFQPALPPMTRASDYDSVAFEQDDLLEIKTDDTVRFDRLGLYYFAVNGAKKGQSVIITDPQFPGTNTFDELVRNLRYLATDEEYTKMVTSFEKKELFDKFWLNNTKSEEKARLSVREYYKRVRSANIFFTSYKEGWKSDRGMIYIVFGAPSRVFHKDNSEMWIYEKTFELPRIAFTFSRIDTAFTSKHYVLQRKAEYQNLWFRVVDLWRKGKKEF